MSSLADTSESISPANITPKRKVFYVGGQYENITDGNTTNQYLLNQIYVEELTPPDHIPHQRYPIIFIAGGGQTGTNFLETPDGRPGWASYFLSKGYTVYLTDQPARGRSPWHPSQGEMVALTTKNIETNFTNCKEYGKWPQAKLHTQWPGTGKVGDPVFDAFYASQVQYQKDRYLAEETNAKSYTALMEKVGDAYVVTHSQAGAFGWRIGDARPRLVKGIVAIEPSGPPFAGKPPFTGAQRAWGLTDHEIEYEPSAGAKAELLAQATVQSKEEGRTECILQAEPAKKLKNLSEVPVLVVTGEASYHQQYDWGTVEFLRQAGVEVESADLGKEGIKGNGHMLFMEMNNLEIAERVEAWLKQH